MRACRAPREVLAHSWQVLTRTVVKWDPETLKDAAPCSAQRGDAGSSKLAVQGVAAAHAPTPADVGWPLSLYVRALPQCPMAEPDPGRT